MPRRRTEKTSRKLSMRLLRKEIDPDSALKDGHGLKEYNWVGFKCGRFWAGVAYDSTVKWATFYDPGINEVLSFDSQGAAAVLFVPVGLDWMVITSGMGFTKIKKECIVHDFGLKVVLNTVDKDTLKSVDVSTPEEITLQKRIQASKDSETSVFGIDIEKDILRKIIGKPKDEEFANLLIGSDALIISCEIELKELPKKCEEIFTKYNSKDYKKEFAWIDHIKNIRDDEMLNKLDGELLKNINDLMVDTSANSNIHFAVPEIENDYQISHYSYSGFYSSKQYDFLSIVDYLNDVKERKPELVFDKETLLRHKACHVSESGGTKHEKWSVYDCIVFEYSDEEKIYVLSGGQWYIVEKEYSKEVNEFFNNIKKRDIFPDAKINDNEKTYIEALKENSEMVCLDTTKIICKGWGSGIEPCDFVSNSNEFIHLKDEAKSSKLSHLFNQGRVSAEAFMREREFREKLNILINASERSCTFEQCSPENLPEPNKYTVVFGVLRKPYRDGTYGLPFFSKVTLRDTVRRLKDMRFNVEFEFIKKIKNTV